MAKKRVHEIAKAQGLTSKELLAKLKAAGVEAKAAQSNVEESDALAALKGSGDGGAATATKTKPAAEEAPAKAQPAKAKADGADAKADGPKADAKPAGDSASAAAPRAASVPCRSSPRAAAGDGARHGGVADGAAAESLQCGRGVRPASR